MIKSFTNTEMLSSDWFRRIKEFHGIYTRYDKLDVIYLGFVYFLLCGYLTQLVLIVPKQLCFTANCFTPFPYFSKIDD
jgi:hypothetical protein